MLTSSRVAVILGFAVLVFIANLGVQRLFPTYDTSSLRRRAGYSALVRLGVAGLLLLGVGVAAIFGY